MAKQLVITLTEEATRKYLQLAQQQSSAEVNEDCEPSDVLLQVNIAASNFYDSEVMFGEKEIGTVEISWLGED